MLIRLDDATWGAARALANGVMTVSAAAEKLNCSRGAIYSALRNPTPPSARKRLCKKESATTAKITRRRQLVRMLIGTTRRVTGSKVVFQRGRPRKDGTPRPQWTVRRQVKKLVFPSPAAVAREMSRRKKHCVSSSTVKRDLKALSLKAYARPRRPRLSAGDRILRVKFCKKMLRWSKRNLQLILWSDEHWCDSNDCGVRFQYLSREAKNSVLPRECEQYPPKVMVWGCIGHNFRHLSVVELGDNNQRLNSEEFVKQCLVPLRKKLAARKLCNNTLWLMQDGARIHWTETAKAYVMNTLRLKIVEAWPPHSPDLNGIETVWSILKRAVAERGPWGVDDLKQFVVEEFEKIDTEVINSICGSFRNKCEEVIRRNGANT